MSDFNERATTACISSTLVIFFYTVLSDCGIVAELDNRAVYDLLVINFLIAIVMYFTDRLPLKNFYACMAVDIADIFLVVFLLGGVIWERFPINPLTFTAFGVMILLVYFLVFGSVTLRNQTDANCINEKLKTRREKE